jgi:hypothetical protein
VSDVISNGGTTRPSMSVKPYSFASSPAYCTVPVFAWTFRAAGEVHRRPGGAELDGDARGLRRGSRA